MRLNQRSTALEIMDQPGHSAEVIQLALKEIDIINRLLGGFSQTIRDLNRFKPNQKPLVIQDWGCGSGDMIRNISIWAKQKDYTFFLTGLDIDPETIKYARQQTPDEAIKYQCTDVMSPEIGSGSVDLVISCLFTHHFADQKWVELVHRMYEVSRVGVIINDLQRHWIAYYSIQLLTRWFARSKMVQADAPLSVARGFTRNEIIQLLKEAKIEKYKIRWNWAFRWSIILLK